MQNINLFEMLNLKKNKIKNLLEVAYKEGFLTQEDLMKNIDKIENDKLTIGVIGQMKSGKSTFLNAFVFENDVLPTATTPMTAALTVISYGEKEKIVSEFYSIEEWNEINRLATTGKTNLNNEEDEKSIAANELVEKARANKINLNDFLGKVKEDEIGMLKEYVGADGKFTPVTKNVTIYSNKEYLKGVEIVDTPGFNDPVVSREQKTKEFLKNADMVLLLSYAGRPFDSTDKNILFDYVANCGIGKVLVVVNKYDIPLESGDSVEKIKKYVINEIQKACEEKRKHYFAEVMKEEEPILISAEMALLAKLPLTTVHKKYKHNWDRYVQNLLNLPTQEALYEKSLFENLVLKIIDRVENQKASILFAKPINAVIACTQNKVISLERVIALLETKKGDLGKNDEELEEKKLRLEKIKRRVERKIDRLEEELDYVLETVIAEGIEEAKAETYKTCDEIDALIDSVSRLQSMNAINNDMIRMVDELLDRSIPQIRSNASNKARQQMIVEIDSALSSIVEILEDKLSEEFDLRDFIKELKSKIKFEACEDCEDTGEISKEDSWLDDVLVIIEGFLKPYTFVLERIGEFFYHDEEKDELHNKVRNLRLSMPYKELFDFICNEKEKNIAICREKIVDELLNPLLQQVEDIISHKGNKESEIQKIDVLLEESKNKLRIFKEKKVKIDLMVQDLKQSMDA